MFVTDVIVCCRDDQATLKSMLARSAKQDVSSPVSATSTETEFKWDQREEEWYMCSGSSTITTDLEWDVEMLNCAIRESRSHRRWKCIRWGRAYDIWRVGDWVEGIGVSEYFMDDDILSHEWYRYWVEHGNRVLKMGTRQYRFSVTARLAAEGIRLYGFPFVKRSEV